VIARALAEDVGSGDVTTDAIVPADLRGSADVVVREAGVICGLDQAFAVLLELDPEARMERLAEDGDLISRPATNPDFVHFESGQVHPATITPSGDRLLVVNTPDNRLSVFDLTLGPPHRNTRIAEIPVGMEPVAVAALDDSTAWVVNNLSDDVSIVNLNTMHVTKALRVGPQYRRRTGK